MINLNDHPFMASAITLARRGLYSTSPNPRVGCIIVNQQGEIVGQGWHEKAGLGHAEINALKAAGTQAKGATAYVSLEPCSHHGKTPPCAEALIKAGISRVVYGMQDPNPAVAGRGIALLKAAGITVDGPLLEADANALNTGFIQRMQTGKPLVISKLASSLDGRTAMASGESQWITGPQARADVQKLRAASCAMITGIGSVLLDDPQLNVRDENLAVNGELRQPLHVIVDSRLRIPLKAKILAGPGRCLVIHAFDHEEKEQALNAIGVECLTLAKDDGQVDLNALIAYVGEHQCNQSMVEAGAKLNGAMQQLGLIDSLWLYMAPTLLGHLAQPLMHLPLSTMAEQHRWQLGDIRQIGNDVRWHLTRVKA